MGAFDGVTNSNTWMIEKCLGWRGLLIEASPKSFMKLRQSGRTATKVHSAVCEDTGSIVLNDRGTENSGDLKTITTTRRKTALRTNATVNVPCKPLSTIMAQSGFPKVDFFSLDVEGSELNVLRNVNASSFSVVLLESVTPEAKQGRKLLHDAGLYRASRALYPHKIAPPDFEPMNDVWLKQGIREHAMSNVTWSRAAQTWLATAGTSQNTRPNIDRTELLHAVRKAIRLVA